MDAGSGPSTSLETARATDPGRVRPENEDYVLTDRILLSGTAFALGLVADGMGGGVRGADASRTAAEAACRSLHSSGLDRPLDALFAAVQAAQDAVLLYSANEGFEGASFGTTLVIALVDETSGDAVVANVGDSRAYIVDDRGARPISRDHSIVAERVAAGRLTPAEARHAPDRNVLTRAVGSRHAVLVDLFGPRGLRPGDRLLLCSDGIHGLLEDEEIATTSGRSSAADLPAALIAQANERGGLDNASVVVIEATQPDGAPSARASGPLQFLKAMRRDDSWPFVTRRVSLERSVGSGERR